MPTCSTGGGWSQIYTGWAYPPKDYARWGELVFQWTNHCLERYGRAEVEQWYWEVWNEPNIGYWRGTPAEFHRLHDYAIAAVRRALPTARVGGPDVAGSGAKFMRDFLEHCLRGTNYATGQVGTPLDFVAFHAKGALTWAFEFEDQPYFAGFRSLASNGIVKPVLNVFRMFSRMGRQRLVVESDAAVPLDVITRRGVREKPDVSALASRGPHELTVLLWHYHDDDVSGPDAAVTLALSGLPFADGNARLEHFRTDEDHSNAFRAWQRMGSPQQPTPEQYAALRQAGQLAALGPPQTVRAENGATLLTFSLPRRGVSLLVLEWGHPPTN